MTEFNEHWWTAASAALARASWQGGIAITVVALLERALPQLPEAWRSWLWRIVFVKLALSLFIAGSVSLPILPAAAPSAAQQTVALPNAAFPPRESRPQISLSAIFVAVWAAGAAMAVALQLRAGRKIRDELRRSASATDHEFQHALSAAAARLGLKTIPEVRLIDAAGGPRLIGVWRPIILAPRAWLATCSPTQLRLAAAHELAHVLRRDLLWNRLVAGCQAIFFFHPWVRAAGRRYLLAQELACDAAALRQVESAPGEFARMLLQLAETPAGTAWDGSAAMTGASLTLRERILAMDRSQLVRRPSRAVGCLVALIVGAAVVPFGFAQQPSAKSPSDESGSAVKKSAGTKKQAAASASAFGSAQGQAAGAGGGQGNGVAGAKAKVGAAVWIFDGAAADNKSSDSPNKTSPKSNAKSKQRKGDGVRVEQSSSQIRIVTNVNGVETVVEAKDMDDLRAKSPAAFETLRKFIKEDGQVEFPMPGVDGFKFPAAGEGFKFPGADGFKFPAAGAEGFKFPAGAAGGDAKQIIKQFRQAAEAGGVQNPEFEKFLDEFQNQLNDE